MNTIKPVRIIIAGGRDFNDSKLLLNTVNKVIEPYEFNDIEIVSGRAKGADKLGEDLANRSGIPVKIFPAEWKDMTDPCVKKYNQFGEYNALAGMNRNKRMAAYATHLIAMWDGKSSGTKDMIDIATSLGLEVTIQLY